MNAVHAKKRHIILYIIAAVTGMLFVAVGFASSYLVTYAIGRNGGGGNRNVSLEVDDAAEGAKRLIAENRRLQERLTADFLKRVEEKQVQITAKDGLILNAGYYENAGSHKWAVVIHGYRSNHENAGHFAQRYYDEGFQVLAPDLRACGESEGDFVGMGWLDRTDILSWTDWIIEQDPQAQIVLHGVSMGAATVMMTSGEDTSDAVKVFVEDCGYTNVWEVFASELKLRFGLPEFPIMYVSNFIASMRAGYQFDEASSLNQLAECTKPMLFIHGTADDFIPFDMLDRLYEAKTDGEKEKIVAEGAGHGEACYLLGDEYWNRVFEFVGRYL